MFVFVCVLSVFILIRPLVSSPAVIISSDTKLVPSNTPAVSGPVSVETSRYAATEDTESQEAPGSGDKERKERPKLRDRTPANRQNYVSFFYLHSLHVKIMIIIIIIIIVIKKVICLMESA